VRRVAQAILRRYGYHVIEARNAGEALLSCERHPRTNSLAAYGRGHAAAERAAYLQNRSCPSLLARRVREVLDSYKRG
jgi:CheY-like chemotaxis protein